MMNVTIVTYDFPPESMPCNDGWPYGNTHCPNPGFEVGVQYQLLRTIGLYPVVKRVGSWREAVDMMVRGEADVLGTSELISTNFDYLPFLDFSNIASNDRVALIHRAVEKDAAVQVECIDGSQIFPKVSTAVVCLLVTALIVSKLLEKTSRTGKDPATAVSYLVFSVILGVFSAMCAISRSRQSTIRPLFKDFGELADAIATGQYQWVFWGTTAETILAHPEDNDEFSMVLYPTQGQQIMPAIPAKAARVMRQAFTGSNPPIFLLTSDAVARKVAEDPRFLGVLYEQDFRSTNQHRNCTLEMILIPEIRPFHFRFWYAKSSPVRARLDNLYVQSNLNVILRTMRKFERSLGGGDWTAEKLCKTQHVKGNANSMLISSSHSSTNNNNRGPSRPPAADRINVSQLKNVFYALSGFHALAIGTFVYERYWQRCVCCLQKENV